MRRMWIRSKASTPYCRPSRPCLLWTIIALIVLVVLYTMLYTPTPVYLQDTFNMRKLSVDIRCDRCNNFTVEYLIQDADFCTDDIYLLTVVISYHPNMDARQAIRKTWGGIKQHKGHNIRTLFVFGIHDDKNFNKQLEVEQKDHGDILQGNFRDNYRSLTNKTMMSLHWIEKHCSNINYVLKTDDDSFNVPQRFIDYLVTVQEPKFVGGYCLTIMPDRRISSKYYVADGTYPDEYYPTYCAGPGYILSIKAVKGIIQVAENVMFLPMEDVYVAGMCRHAANMKYTQIPGVIISTEHMTRCSLATWAKNGHNVVPGRAVMLWQELEAAHQDIDCAGSNTWIFLGLLIFLAAWCRLLLKLWK